MQHLLIDYAFVALGLFAVLIAAFGREFYKGDDTIESNTRSSTWSGKLVFLTVGLFFIALGSLDLFGIIALNSK